MDLVIYTAVMGNPDILYEPPDTKWDKFCFTDLECKKKSRYKIVAAKVEGQIAKKRQRRIKIFWPAILDNYEYSFYLDSNVDLKVDPAELIKFLKPKSDILVFRHPGRDCLYAEARLCVDVGFANPEIAAKQLAAYRKDKYPKENGLYACTVILRRHTEAIKNFSRDWWRQVEQYTKRDQISFPYMVWKHKLKVSTFPRGTLYNNEWFKLEKHADPGHFRKPK